MRSISVPLANPLYRAARMMGVLKRDGHKWNGDFETIGEPIVQDNGKDTPAAVTEVAYVQLGDVHLAAIPGEIYPELVYGRCQDPADPAADFPDAPLEPAVVDVLPGKKMLLVGLANDELGYIVPKRQWDERPPFAYGHKEAQYGEGNSCGPLMAPILLEALKRRVAEVAHCAESVAGRSLLARLRTTRYDTSSRHARRDASSSAIRQGVRFVGISEPLAPRASALPFADRLAAAVQNRRTPVVVGLDPRYEQLPEGLRTGLTADPTKQATAYLAFCQGVIDVVAGLVPAIKPQSAFFEQIGPAGMAALAQVIAYLRQKGLLVILDGKRNDIGSTATAYAQGYLGAGATSAWAPMR